MRLRLQQSLVVATTVSLMVIGGCDSPSTDSNASGNPSTAEDHDHDHDSDHSGHDHAKEHEGPHGGHVIELGRNHEYHAEVVENEVASSVTVYLLGKNLKELPIDQSTVVMNLSVDGEAKTFNLNAAGGNAGKASCFEATGPDLFEALHEHEATGKLRVTINGTPYSGTVEHHHHDADDHDDHGHEH